MIGLVALTGMAQSERDAEILPSVRRSLFSDEASSGQTSSPPIVTDVLNEVDHSVVHN